MSEPLTVERHKSGFPMLCVYGAYVADLTEDEADAIEAQLSGPDLTELREAVDAARDAARAAGAWPNPAVIDAAAAVHLAAARLVYPEGDA